MNRSFARAVSGPLADYIAILQRRVNADKAAGRKGFRNRLFLVESGFDEPEAAKIRPKQPAPTCQGAACSKAVVSKPQQAGQLRWSGD